jgi:hypothetical protein
MTPLRLRMIEDMQIRNLSLQTQTAYVQQVSLQSAGLEGTDPAVFSNVPARSVC